MITIDNGLIGKIDRLRFSTRKRITGLMRGRRLSPKKGVSIEFADYRHYSEGDDLRHLDWNILARLDQASIRTYRDELETPIYILADNSASMDFGEPTKYDYASALAFYLGYIGVSGGDAVRVACLSKPQQSARVIRSRAKMSVTRSLLDNQKPEATDLLSGLNKFLATINRAGILIIISDALHPDFEDAIRAAASRGHEIVILQILSDIDLNPDLEGDIKLLDSDSDAFTEITATSSVIREYRRRLDLFCDKITANVKRAGGIYLQIKTDEPLENVLLERLRRTGLII